MNGKLLLNTITGFLLVILWTYAAFSKLFSYRSFRFQLIDHPLLRNHTSLVAWLVPAIELIAATLLIFPIIRKHGFYLSALLLIAFTIYIVYMLLYYPKSPCSCSGLIESLSWKAHVVFNASFLLGTGICIIQNPSSNNICVK